MAALRLLALLPAAAAAAAQDTLALIQTSVRTQADACTCLPWHDAYNMHKSKCGYGREMYINGMMGKNYGPAFAQQDKNMKFEFCEQYFYNLPADNFCQNEKFGDGVPNWCYVSPECSEGTHLYGPLSTKTCASGRDKLLSDMRFEDFAAYAYKNKPEMGLMVQYAYPTWQGEKLPDVMEFWGLKGDAQAKPLSEDLRRRLQAQVDSGKTVFFTSRSGHPPFGIAEGGKLYYMNFNPAGNPGFAKREDMNTWGCVGGGGSANMELW